MSLQHCLRSSIRGAGHQFVYSLFQCLDDAVQASQRRFINNLDFEVGSRQPAHGDGFRLPSSQGIRPSSTINIALQRKR